MNTLKLTAQLFLCLTILATATLNAHDLGGTWTDSEGNKISVEQKGMDLRATMESKTGRRYWQRADGQIIGNRITLSFPTGDLTATIRNPNTLGWSNGSAWTRGNATTLSLTGFYVDGNGDRIQILQPHGKVIAHMRSHAGLKYWQMATGRVEEDTLILNFPTQQLTATILQNGESLRWCNQTTWKRERNKTLSGGWRDSEGNRIVLTQKGDQLEAHMISRNGRKFWTTASGTKTGNQVTLRFQNSEGSLTATVRNQNLLVWSNGSNWVRSY